MKEKTLLAEALDAAHLHLGPEVALVIFAVFMLAVFVWIFRPHSARTYADISRRALADEVRRE